ncbi:MAG: hypothetical protein KZQ59_05565 [Candidatus Thiodiazotropha sp. (ex Lucinoma aequizonata)]|nr:hypothetical protein [Candidatus Thiodiazotropha sp. (ex Lucinoma aequizonata)]MCU7895729.1 hypothetical protein [Candidatus Thiodiazotropha sp. (ex Lucinoma aequizonata)]MCU7897271.1 hypothetical protein [Candidatus Thiodiazotropha sp. (ex Lucinoma aequizonata)]
MRDKDLYAQILGIKSLWQVTSVELAVSDGNVTVHVTIQPILPWPTRLDLMHLHEIRFFALKKQC